jgi:Transposase DDE domain
MLPTKTLQQREQELQSLLATPAGRKEVHELVSRYHTHADYRRAVEIAEGEGTASPARPPTGRKKLEQLDARYQAGGHVGHHLPFLVTSGSREPGLPARGSMGTAAAKAVYKQRAATIECVNAQARNRQLVRLTVRGRWKAKAVALWYGIAHNVRRAVSLGAALVRAGAARRALATEG